MKKFILISSLFISGVITAQTKFNVTVQSNSFIPSTLNIFVGDTVEWTNVGGNHNVNGSQTTFPSNPASFGNSVGAGWTYTFVFTVAGTYAYRCDPHFSLGMAGGINVQVSTGLSELNTINSNFYPNPTSNDLFFANFEKINRILIYTLTGAEVLNTELHNEKLDVSHLHSGVYFVKIISDEGQLVKKLVIQ